MAQRSEPSWLPRASLRKVFGLLLVLAFGSPWGDRRVWADSPMREPLIPAPSSLAPVDTEAFRQRYGQEALFRLKLGVEAGERVTPRDRDLPCSGRWDGSAQAKAFLAEVERQHWYEAGQVLGTWRRSCGGG